MAKALRNREIAFPAENSQAELEEFAKATNRSPQSGVNAAPGSARPGAQRIHQLKPTPIAGYEQQGMDEKTAKWKEAAEEKIEDLKARGAETLDEVQESASAAYEQTRARALAAYENVKEKSGELARSARRRARYVADEYPVQVIAVVAGVAFVCGVLLRVWRSSRYE